MAGKTIFTLALTVFSRLGVAASPYENLAFASKQQLSISELRQQCGGGKSVPDEKSGRFFSADSLLMRRSCWLRRRTTEKSRNATAALSKMSTTLT